MSSGPLPDSLYQYEPLKTSTSVRFLRLTGPKYFTGARQYELVEYDLEKIIATRWSWSVSYVAISYAWGTASRLKRFQLLNGQLLITPSLDLAMPHIARAVVDIQPERPHLFWIDQICINQENSAEREQQVRLMQDLYSKAYEVIVWLGGDDDHTRKVFEMVRVVGQAASGQELKADQRKKLEKYLGQNGTRNWRNIWAWKDLAFTSHPDFNEYEIALLKFFDRPWFQRAWTFQEAVLARSVVFLAGNERAGMQELSWTLEAMGHTRMGKTVRHARSENRNAALGYESFQAMETLRYQMSGEQPVREFLHVLSELAPYKKATDTRDLCFAFLGFQKNANIDIRPDYSPSSTTERVFSRTAREIMDGSQSLDIFGVLHRHGTKISADSLPTWVPDWSAELLAIPLCASHISNNFSACKDYYHSPVLGSPVVRGRIIDTVQSVHNTATTAHSPLQRFDMRDINIHDIFDLDRFIIEIDQISETEQRPLSRTRLLRTLLADGANAGASEYILQTEAERGLHEWRVKELLEAYDRWENIQAKARDPDNYESMLDAEALLAYGGVMMNRSLITTTSWRLGIAARSIHRGDFVCILHGSRTPIILRQQGYGKFVVIGQAYVEVS
jgi:hypothetical protein